MWSLVPFCVCVCVKTKVCLLYQCGIVWHQHGLLFIARC